MISNSSSPKKETKTKKNILRQRERQRQRGSNNHFGTSFYAVFITYFQAIAVVYLQFYLCHNLVCGGRYCIDCGMQWRGGACALPFASALSFVCLWVILVVISFFAISSARFVFHITWDTLFASRSGFNALEICRPYPFSLQIIEKYIPFTILLFLTASVVCVCVYVRIISIF